MNIRHRFVIVTVICAASVAASHAQCSPVQDGDRARLVEYVQKKYKVPSRIQPEITTISEIGQTCFRKIEFRAKGPNVAFHLDLYPSPDLRFLTRDLMDSTVDPAIEEREKAAALASGLDRPGAPALGRSGAPVTIAVFSDFQCPYCAGFASTMKEVLAQEAGKARVVFHTLPLPMHAWARPAAEAALCAQQQGDEFFWPLHDFMFSHQKEITPDTLQPKLAAVTKSLTHFDQGKFATCLVERQTAAQVDGDVVFAQRNGVNATPTVFINGQQTKIVAPEQLRTLIEQLSADSKTTVRAAELKHR